MHPGHQQGVGRQRGACITQACEQIVELEYAEGIVQHASMLAQCSCGLSSCMTAGSVPASVDCRQLTSVAGSNV